MAPGSASTGSLSVRSARCLQACAYMKLRNVPGFVISFGVTGLRFQSQLRLYLTGEMYPKDCVQQPVSYGSAYRCGHYYGKGRVLEFLREQESDISEKSMTWSRSIHGDVKYRNSVPIYIAKPCCRTRVNHTDHVLKCVMGDIWE